MDDASKKSHDAGNKSPILCVVRRAVLRILRLLRGRRGGAGGSLIGFFELVFVRNRSGEVDLRASDFPIPRFVVDRSENDLPVLVGPGLGLLCPFRVLTALAEQCFVVLHFRRQVVEPDGARQDDIAGSGHFKRQFAAAKDVLPLLHKAGIVDGQSLFIVGDPQLSKIVKTVIEQLHCVVELIRGFLAEDHADELQVVPFRAGHQRLSGVFRIARLAADDAVIFHLPVDQLVLVEDRVILGLSVRGLHVVARDIGKGGKVLVGKEFSRDQRHIIGAGVVLRIRKAVGVGKVRVLAPQLFGPFGHHLRESVQ